MEIVPPHAGHNSNLVAQQMKTSAFSLNESVRSHLKNSGRKVGMVAAARNGAIGRFDDRPLGVGTA